MTILQKEEPGRGKFFVEEQGRTVGELLYRLPEAQKMIIDHTEVDASQAGKGTGRQLVEAAVNYARKNQLRITPLCPFANALFHKKPEWADVLENR